MKKLQFSLLDLFWITGLAACIVVAITTSEPHIAWIGVASVLFFVWNRPVLLRFWTIADVGIGVGLWTAGGQGNSISSMDSGALIAWGVAMVVGGFVAFCLFDLLKPADRTSNST